ncbi:hypothetical protein ISCGN_023892 [Ixodes scapularis]
MNLRVVRYVTNARTINWRRLTTFAAACEQYLRSVKKKKTRKGVRELLKSRKTLGEYATIVRQMHEDPDGREFFECFQMSRARTPVYEKQGPKWCIASPGGPRRVQTYPGLGSTTRMPFSPDTGKPRTAIRGRANPHGSGSVETPLSKHLLSQCKGATAASLLTKVRGWRLRRVDFFVAYVGGNDLDNGRRPDEVCRDILCGSPVQAPVDPSLRHLCGISATPPKAPPLVQFNDDVFSDDESRDFAALLQRHANRVEQAVQVDREVANQNLQRLFQDNQPIYQETTPNMSEALAAAVE